MFDFFTKSFILSIIDNKNVLEEALTMNVKIFSKNNCMQCK
ncbi:NrdH-redoxin, partial [Enterococcus faecium]